MLRNRGEGRDPKGSRVGVADADTFQGAAFAAEVIMGLTKSQLKKLSNAKVGGTRSVSDGSKANETQILPPSAGRVVRPEDGRYVVRSDGVMLVKPGRKPLPRWFRELTEDSGEPDRDERGSSGGPGQ